MVTVCLFSNLFIKKVNYFAECSFVFCLFIFCILFSQENNFNYEVWILCIISMYLYVNKISIARGTYAWINIQHYGILVFFYNKVAEPDQLEHRKGWKATAMVSLLRLRKKRARAVNKSSAPGVKLVFRPGQQILRYAPVRQLFHQWERLYDMATLF